MKEKFKVGDWVVWQNGRHKPKTGQVIQVDKNVLYCDNWSDEEDKTVHQFDYIQFFRKMTKLEKALR